MLLLLSPLLVLTLINTALGDCIMCKLSQSAILCFMGMSDNDNVQFFDILKVSSSNFSVKKNLNFWKVSINDEMSIRLHYQQHVQASNDESL